MILITFNDDKGRCITVDDKEHVSLSRTIREDTLVHVENEYVDNILNKIRTPIKSKDSLKFREFGRSFIKIYSDNLYIVLNSYTINIYRGYFNYSYEKGKISTRRTLDVFNEFLKEYNDVL